MKSVTFKFALGKQPIVEAHGFAGVGCQAATAIGEVALGRVTEVTPKLEMYQAEVVSGVNQTLNNGGVE